MKTTQFEVAKDAITELIQALSEKLKTVYKMALESILEDIGEPPPSEPVRILVAEARMVLERIKQK